MSSPEACEPPSRNSKPPSPYSADAVTWRAFTFAYAKELNIVAIAAAASIGPTML